MKTTRLDQIVARLEAEKAKVDAQMHRINQMTLTQWLALAAELGVSRCSNGRMTAASILAKRVA